MSWMPWRPSCSLTCRRRRPEALPSLLPWSWARASSTTWSRRFLRPKIQRFVFICCVVRCYRPLFFCSLSLTRQSHQEHRQHLRQLHRRGAPAEGGWIQRVVQKIWPHEVGRQSDRCWWVHCTGNKVYFIWRLLLMLKCAKYLDFRLCFDHVNHNLKNRWK